jgi:lipoprotein-anchoring transpeptidase ErfK/SrfK
MVLHGCYLRNNLSLTSTLLSLTILAMLPPSSLAQTSTTARLFEIATLQSALDRNGFGVGFIDGRDGARTRGALLDYCRAAGLSEEEGRRQLLADAPSLTTTYPITQSDLNTVGRAPVDWLEASVEPAMAFTSLDESLSEKFHVSRPFLARLNPGITNWNSVSIGQSVNIPTPRPASWAPSASRLEVDCGACRVRAFDADDLLVASFPCSIAKDLKRVPTGELVLVAFAPNPNYTFDPVNFPESARAQEIGRKLILPPGPNNPVGVYWISLSQPGFGIHGTPKPETIGRPESHGCFRMTNWDIITLARMVTAGTPVRITTPPAPTTP